MITSDVGTIPATLADDSVDLYALTDTRDLDSGVMTTSSAPPAPTAWSRWTHLGRRRTAVDPTQFDCYDFAPRSPSPATEVCGLRCARRGGRTHRVLAASGRWTPAFFDLKIALDNSRLNQTYNTPRARNDPPARQSGQVVQRQRGPVVLDGARLTVRRDPLHLGRGVGLRDALRHESRRAQQRRRDDRLQGRDRRHGDRCRCCARTVSSIPSPIGARTQPLRIAMFPTSTPRTSRPCARASTASSATSELRRDR